MNRKYIFIVAIILGFGVIGCKHSGRHNENEVTSSVAGNGNNAVNPAMNTAAQIYAKQEVPVLCYHKIDDGKKSEYKVSPATFAAHMKILADSGYHSVSPAQLYDYLVYNKALPEKPVMISFDDSRVEHAMIAAPVMEKNGFRGVFFIMTITYNKKNYMTTDQIARLSKAGHTIGLHSWDHTMVTKYKEEADWEKQVIKPKEKLEKIIGKSVEYWAYPNGVFDYKGAAELSKYFKLSFSLSTKRDSLLPLQTVRRIIVPECTAQGLLKSMHRSFQEKRTKNQEPRTKNQELRTKNQELRTKTEQSNNYQ